MKQKYGIWIWEDVLFPIADFYLSKERWDEAIEIFEELEAISKFDEKSAEYYQKVRVCITEKKEIRRSCQGLSESRYAETGQYLE